MTYALEQDMVDRFGTEELITLTDRDGSAGAIVTSVLDLALNDADDEINGYLAARYEFPLPTIPSVLVRLACDIARYRLYADLSTEEVRNRYKDSITLLTKISQGVVGLGLPVPPPSANGMVFIQTSPRITGRDKGSIF